MPSPLSRSIGFTLGIPATVLLAVFASQAPRFGAAELSPTEQSWNQPVAPYRIMGPLYYVGASDLAVFLITTPEGHILINSGFAETVPLVRESMRQLGFRFEDVKVLLASHAHSDHVGGHALVKEATGARIMAAEGDVGVMESGGRGDFRFEGEISWRGSPVDRVLHDGDTVVLGGMTLTARVTPGHTRGCTTWTFDLPDGSRTRKAVVVGSMSINPGVVLVGNPKFPEIADEYARSFRVLRSLPVDVYLAPHVRQFWADKKVKRLGEPTNPFVDPAGYKRALDEWERSYGEQLARERAAAGIFEDVPERPDPRARYALYVHGRILEEQGIGAVSADFGLYQYEAILHALAARGFKVVAERRAGDPGPDYPKKLAARVRKLIQAGVPASQVTVVGASKGGLLTLAAAAEVQEDAVSYVVLAGCGSPTEAFASRLRGRILSVYDADDRFRPSCEPTFAGAPKLADKREIVVRKELDHGLLYRPLADWLDPLVEWTTTPAKASR
ncbi:MAG TPA: subclass B3 metallo-beta-lactamase [Vicinamibacteria bacterium]